MLYAVRSKPESLLYYPVFKLIFQEGWTGMPADAFKDLILSQIQSIQSQIAEEQGLTVNDHASRRHGTGHDQPGANLRCLLLESFLLMSFMSFLASKISSTPG